MSEERCPYCHGGEELAAFGIKIADISQRSGLYLFKEQTHYGRVIVAYKKHISEITDLAPEELALYMADVAGIARLLHTVFTPAKVNYGAYSDRHTHLHFSLIPKYRDGFEWGDVFQLNPRKNFPTDEGYAELIGRITAALSTGGVTEHCSIEQSISMSQHDCPYCNGGETLDAFAIKINDLSEYSSLYLFKEQSHPGRVVVAYRGHVSEIADLTSEQLRGYSADLARVARMLHKVFKPAKINYGAYGDRNPHLHFHLVPKYQDAFEWGGIFQMNPQRVFLSKGEYADRIALITAALKDT